MPTYTIDQYTATLKKMLDARAEANAKTDAMIDKVLAGLIAATGASAEQETETYLALRNAKERSNSDAGKREDAFKAAIEHMGNLLLARLEAQGVESMRAGSGTFYREKVYRPAVADWKVFYAWIKETDNFEFLEKRVTKKAVVDYLDSEKDLPPGINLSSAYEARVRKSSK